MRSTCIPTYWFCGIDSLSSKSDFTGSSTFIYPVSSRSHLQATAGEQRWRAASTSEDSQMSLKVKTQPHYMDLDISCITTSHKYPTTLHPHLIFWNVFWPLGSLFTSSVVQLKMEESQHVRGLEMSEWGGEGGRRWKREREIHTYLSRLYSTELSYISL